MNTIKTPQGKVIDCGIDYLTLTVSKKNPHHTRFWNLSREFLTDQMCSGETIKDQSNGFYQGWRGKHFFTGDNDNGTIIETSGKLADTFAETFFTWNIDANCTRLDAQQTIEYQEEPTHHGTRLRRAVRKFEMGTETYSRQAITVFEDRVRDTGFSAGTRGAARFVRAYHAATGGHPQFSDNAFRYEVEFRKETAVAALAMFQSSFFTGPLSCSLVQAELMRMGINFDWYNDRECPKLKAVYEDSDNEKRLQWLMHSCAPAFAKCLEDPQTRPRALAWWSGLTSESDREYRFTALKPAKCMLDG